MLCCNIGFVVEKPLPLCFAATFCPLLPAAEIVMIFPRRASLVRGVHRHALVVHGVLRTQNQVQTQGPAAARPRLTAAFAAVQAASWAPSVLRSTDSAGSASSSNASSGTTPSRLGPQVPTNPRNDADPILTGSLSPSAWPSFRTLPLHLFP